MVLGFAAFYVAFIFTMPTLAGIPAPYCAAGKVLVLHPWTILGFLLPLQLNRARISAITVESVAMSTFVVHRTTEEKIRGPFAIGAGGLLHVFQLSTSAAERVRVGLTRPPSTNLLSRGLPSWTFAQVVVHVRVVLSLHGQFDQKIDQIIVGVRPCFPPGRLPCSSPKSWEESSLLAKGEAQ